VNCDLRTDDNVCIILIFNLQHNLFYNLIIGVLNFACND